MHLRMFKEKLNSIKHLNWFDKKKGTGIFMTSVRYENKDFKSILNKYKFIDNWFWNRYSINTYNGCEHACNYCDSRSHKYHLHPEFDHVIYVKNNVGDMLENRLSRARTLLPDVVGFSGSCDPYHPAEKKYKNTRRCLEVLENHNYPVHIITKSDGVIDDIDLLSRIGEQSWCTVSITITTLNKELADFLEPRAPGPEKRLEAIRKLKKIKNVQAGVNLIPIVPFLSDSDESLKTLVQSIKEAGADFILFGGGMTMRDRQAVWFLKCIEEKYPELLNRYLELYKAKIIEGKYQGRYAPSGEYIKRINSKMFELTDRYKIKTRIKRYIPEDFRKETYIITEELLNEAYFAQATGKVWTNLFWAGQNLTNIKEPLRSIAARGELQKIRNVDEVIEARIKDRLQELT